MASPSQPSDLSLWPRVTSAIRPDPRIERAVEALLERMGLEQKVGQMIQPEILAISPAEVREYHIGSVLNGGGSWPGKRKEATAADWAALADAYYAASTNADGDHLGIPVLWGTDAVHGHSNVMGATLFPHNIGLGAAGDPDLIERIGEITAREVAATGLDWTFAPTLAVISDDRWGRTYEGYSEDPDIVRAYAGRLVEGIQGVAGGEECLGPERVLACAKHFLGDGGTTGGVDQGDTVIDEATLIARHAQGYVTALAAGAQTVMASFSSINGRKMHGSHYLLTEVLRGPLGFDGLVVGDWNGHGQLEGCSNESSAAAIRAGVDLIMVPFDWRAFFHNTVAQVRRGEIAETRIDEAVRRILRVKMRAGLLGPLTDRGKPSSRPLAGDQEVLGCEAHRAVAREAVRKSLVLLKNRDGTLPLSPSARVLVAGKGAHDIGIQSGGWTLSWQGTDTVREDFPNAESVYEGISAAVSATGGEAVLSVDGSGASPAFDVLIAVIGETPYAEGEGDERLDLHHARRHPEDLALLERLRAQAPGVPIVTVLLTGRPLYANRELNRSDAFAVAWLPGGQGGGVADVLFGAHDFSGRLTFSWPRTAGDTALHREDAERALFPYGFGLSHGSADVLGELPEEPLPLEGGAPLRVFRRGAGRGFGMRLAKGGVEVAVGTTGRVADLSAETVDGGLQGSARRVHWRSGGTLAWSGRAVDATPFETLLFRVRILVHEATAVRLWGLVDLVERFAEVSDGQWHELRISLDEAKRAGLDVSRLEPAFELSVEGALLLEIEEISFRPEGT